MEKALYNGILSGVSLDGTKFFYVNPLEVVPEACEKDQIRNHVKPERQKWFGCACCPPNLARMIASLPGYIYTKKDDTLYVHLYVGNESTTDINGTKVAIIMKSDYPADGNISVAVSPAETLDASIAFRIPGWCRRYTVCRNGHEIVPDGSNYKDGYLYVHGSWTDGDMVTLHFEMPVQVVCASPLVRENIGKAAVMRGPVVYCLEEEDNGSYLSWIALPKVPSFTCSYEKDMLGGIVKLRSNGLVLDAKNWSDSSLYEIYKADTFSEKSLEWIPYYAWANRSCGEMAVWIRKE